MPLLQFRLRTLMIAVAVAAIECWLMDRYPSLGLLLLGPLVGTTLGSLRSRDRVVGYLGGGVAGGVVATAMCVVFMETFANLRTLGLGPDWEVYVIWLVMDAFAGFVVGLAFLSLDVFGSWVLRDARLAEDPAATRASRPREAE